MARTRTRRTEVDRAIDRIRSANKHLVGLLFSEDELVAREACIAIPNLGYQMSP